MNSVQRDHKKDAGKNEIYGYNKSQGALMDNPLTETSKTLSTFDNNIGGTTERRPVFFTW